MTTFVHLNTTTAHPALFAWNAPTKAVKTWCTACNAKAHDHRVLADLQWANGRTD